MRFYNARQCFHKSTVYISEISITLFSTYFCFGIFAMFYLLMCCSLNHNCIIGGFIFYAIIYFLLCWSLLYGGGVDDWVDQLLHGRADGIHCMAIVWWTLRSICFEPFSLVFWIVPFLFWWILSFWIRWWWNIASWLAFQTT